jgi:uncharacterized protein (DUF885 family)
MASGIDISINEAHMDRMSNLLRNAGKQFEDVKDEMLRIAAKIDNGALQGQAGDELSAVLRSAANAQVNQLSQKMDELAKLIDRNVEQHREAVARAKGLR